MKIKLMSTFTIGVLIFGSTLPVFSQRWFDGKWDSEYTSNMLDAHPLSIVVRVEVYDEDSRTPIRGADVRLEGRMSREALKKSEYIELGVYSSYTIDDRFKLNAFTDYNGIVVFALRWKKSEAMVRHDIFDDIERVQQISVRKEGFRYNEIAFIPGVARQYLFEDDPTSFWNEWPFGGNGWEIWRRKVRYMQGARYFQLSIKGTRFNDYDNDACTLPILFRKVRDERYDYEWPNMSNLYNNPPDRIGPFIMIPFEIGLKRIYNEYERRKDNSNEINRRNQQVNRTIIGTYYHSDPRKSMPNLKEEWIRLDPDGTYRMEIWAEDGSLNIWGYYGNYSIQDNKIILVDPDGEKNYATLKGDIITFDIDTDKNKFIKKK